jgi:hypothetical protein
MSDPVTEALATRLDTIDQAFTLGAHRALQEAPAGELIRLYRDLRAEILGVDQSLGVPSNLRLGATTFQGTRPICSWTADAPTSADELWWYHSFGDPYRPSERLIAKLPVGDALTIGGTAPWLLSPGGPYTLAVYAAAQGRRAPVPLVAEFTIPTRPPGRIELPPPIEVIQLDKVLEAETYSYQFDHAIEGPMGSATLHWLYDTGAFRFLIVLTPAAAAALGLANLGPIDLSGVGGSASGYKTTVAIPLGDRVYQAQKAVVDPTFTQNLWGAEFEIDQALAFALNPVSARLAFWHAADVDL